MSKTIKVDVVFNDKFFLTRDINGEIREDSIVLKSTQLCLLYDCFVEKKRHEARHRKELERVRQAEQIKNQAERLIIVLKGHPINQQIKLLVMFVALPLIKRFLKISSVKETDTE